MNARAVVAVAPRKVSFEEIEVPEPGADDVVIRTEWSWISNGTEGSFIRGERIKGDTPRSATDPLPFPHVPGYQKTGLVERTGRNVTEFAPGDRVFATVSHTSGMFFPFGGHVSPAVTHRSQVWQLPGCPGAEAYSGLVLAQVGYNTGIRPSVASGDLAIVIGDGLVGHWTAQTLRWRGASVAMIGKHPERLARFDPGANGLTVNAAETSWLDRVREWSLGEVQVVADTVGSLQTVYDLLPLLRRNGHVSSAGFYGEQGKIDIQRLRDREITLHCPAGWSKERMDATLEMVRDRHLATLSLVTHRFSAREAAAAYDLVLSRREPALGVLLDWSEVGP